MYLSFKIINLFGILSPWGSSNYRPSAPFLYEVAISAIIIIIIIIIVTAGFMRLIAYQTAELAASARTGYCDVPLFADFPFVCYF